MSYIADADISARLGADAYRKLLDEDQDGSADSSALTRLHADSFSYVNEAIEDLYRDKDGATWPLEAPYPTALKRIQLDAAEAYAAKRYPEWVYKGDWMKMFEHVDKQLDRFRSYQRSMGDGEDDPGPADDGIVVYTSTQRGW